MMKVGTLSCLNISESLLLRSSRNLPELTQEYGARPLRIVVSSRSGYGRIVLESQASLGKDVHGSSLQILTSLFFQSTA